MTKPSRSASKGLDDFSGLSLYFVDKALRRENPAKLNGEMHDSEPPQTIATAAPLRIKFVASPEINHMLNLCLIRGTWFHQNLKHVPIE